MPIYRQMHDNSMYVPMSDTGLHNTNYNRPNALISDEVSNPSSPASNTQLRRVVRPDLFGTTIKYANIISVTHQDILTSAGVEYAEEFPVKDNLPAYNLDLAKRAPRCIYIGNTMVSEQDYDRSAAGNHNVGFVTFGYPIIGNGIDDLPPMVNTFVDYVYGPRPEAESRVTEFADGFNVSLGFRPYGLNGDFALELSTQLFLAGIELVMDRVICCPYSGDPAGSTGAARIGKVINVGAFLAYDDEANTVIYAMYINGKKEREGVFPLPFNIQTRVKPHIIAGQFSFDNNISSCVAFDVNETRQTRSYKPEDYAMQDVMAFYRLNPVFTNPDANTPTIEEPSQIVTPSQSTLKVSDKFYNITYQQYPAATFDAESRKMVDCRVWARPINNVANLLFVGDYIDMTLSADNSKPDTPFSLDSLTPAQDVKMRGIPAFGAINDGQYYPMGIYGGQRNWDLNTRSPSLLNYHPNHFNGQYLTAEQSGEFNKTRVTFSLRYVGSGFHVQVPAQILFAQLFASTPMVLDDIFTCPFLTGNPKRREDIRSDVGSLAKILEGIRSSTRLRGTRQTQVYNGLIDAVRPVMGQYVDRSQGFGGVYLSTIIDADNNRIFNVTGSNDLTTTSSIAKAKV